MRLHKLFSAKILFNWRRLILHPCLIERASFISKYVHPFLKYSSINSSLVFCTHKIESLAHLVWYILRSLFPTETPGGAVVRVLQIDRSTHYLWFVMVLPCSRGSANACYQIHILCTNFVNEILFKANLESCDAYNS